MMAQKVRESPLFAGLSMREYDALIDVWQPETVILSKDGILIEEGGRASAFWIVTDGRLKGARYHYDGRLDLVHLYAERDIVGLDVICTRTRKSPLRISAVDAARLAAFHAAVLDGNRLSEETTGRLRMNIIRILADESIRKQYKIDVLYQRSLRARIAVFLRHMSEKVGEDVFDVNMDREQFAHYLGVNRSALSHALSLMSKEGVIRFRKGRFEILNKQALEEK
ncbi:MAG: Crp/Fnr family transcriptional regulator [Clostridiales Family XIII bacterium]|jgi:CRP-like cAMP-binding protein|nr:Crp/Fnr family transcriptional regulator [Clostridiales Family XIII bacterium]